MEAALLIIRDHRGQAQHPRQNEFKESRKRVQAVHGSPKTSRQQASKGLQPNQDWVKGLGNIGTRLQTKNITQDLQTPNLCPIEGRGDNLYQKSRSHRGWVDGEA